MSSTDTTHQVTIIGSGPAGLTAAVYAARANLEPLVIEGVIEGGPTGGQLTLTTDVENFPGFADGIMGPELILQMRAQAERFGTTFITEDIVKVNVEQRPFTLETASGNAISTQALIVATGAKPRRLDIPGEAELWGSGVSACATCDGFFFRDKHVVVVGGGDSAMEEATFLTKFADTVYIAHRREEFRAEQYWINRVHEKVEAGEIEIMKNTEVTELHGSQAEGVDHVTLVRNDKGHPTDRLDDPETEEFEFDVGAVFFAIGHTPNTAYLEGTGVQMDDEGYLRTQGGDGGGQTETDVPGIFGAGDVVDFHYQQAVTAAGMGSKAALDADEYLEDLERASTSGEAEATAADD